MECRKINCKNVHTLQNVQTRFIASLIIKCDSPRLYRRDLSRLLEIAGVLIVETRFIASPINRVSD